MPSTPAFVTAHVTLCTFSALLTVTVTGARAFAREGSVKSNAAGSTTMAVGLGVGFVEPLGNVGLGTAVGLGVVVGAVVGSVVGVGVGVSVIPGSVTSGNAVLPGVVVGAVVGSVVGPTVTTGVSVGSFSDSLRFCALITSAITTKTTAIMPVHCYGQPCDVLKIKEIANKYGLKVIYDAAHAFGVEIGGKSVLEHGDMSTLSFHATKVYNTIEGGALVCRDAETKQRIDYLKNFGFAGETSVVAPGINGKLDEVRAAYGLLALISAMRSIGMSRKANC